MSEQKNNTPNIRFPEFSGEWEEKKLEEVCEVKRGVRVTRRDLKEDGQYPVFQNTDKPLGFYDFSNVKANNPFVIIGGSAGLIGFCKTDFWAADDCVSFGDSDIMNKYFLYSTLLLHNMEIKNLVRGGNIPRIERVALERLQISIPTLAEQEKIASCLSAMDDLIVAQAEKVEALKEKKTGLMQQLFPQPGETTPRLRFPEFTGEWEEKKVKEIFEITRGQVLPAAKTKPEVDGLYKYPVYSSQTMRNGLMGYYNEALFNNAITWTTDGANAGTVRYRKGDFYCTNVCGVLLSKDGYANECIAELLNIICKSHVSFVGNPKLMNNVMAEIVIPIPSLQEQQKIASCLSALDDQIAAETEKLTALKDYKKGLMQQLFPQPAK